MDGTGEKIQTCKHKWLLLGGEADVELPGFQELESK